MASRTLKVEIIGDASSFQRALGNATKTSSGLSRAFRGLGIAAAGAGVAIGAGFVYTLKRGFDELADAQKVAAQTSAVIKSTGSAANVSKAQVEGYAEALSLVSGVDDEVIASGENMLLTFKNIRNEAGKGNDIFKQSTEALLDMSTALGTDMNKSAIQLGKALNDPIKGITALQRVGVSFTASQKETIKGMVESGNVMGAQKLILKELNSEFGGSAKAFGETMPGQLAKLKNAFDEVAANLAVKFLPVLMGLVQWINTNWGTISTVFDAVGTAITATFQGIGAAVDYLRGQWEIHRESAIAAWNAVRDAVMKFITFFQTSVLPAIQTVIDAAKAIWENFGGEITTILTRLVATVKAGIQNMLAPIKIILAVLRGDWSAAWGELSGVVTRTLGVLAGNVKALGGAIVSALLGALAGLASKVSSPFVSAFESVRTALSNALSWITTKARQIAMALLEPFTAIPGPLGKKAQEAVDKLFNAVEGGKPKVLKAAQAMSDALAESAGKPGDKKLQQEALKKTREFIQVLTEAQGPAKTEATKIAQNISQGIIAIPDVSGEIAAKVSAMVRAGLDQVSAGKGKGAVGSTAGEYAGKKIGKQIPEGVAEEAGKGSDKVAAATARMTRKAIEDAGPLIKVAANLLGGAAVQEILNGFRGKEPTAKQELHRLLTQAIEAGRQAIADARQGYADAFAGLFQAGADAIAAKYAGWQPPSLLKAQREAEAREAAALKKSIEDAQAALQAAVAAGQALPPLKMGEVPTAEFKKAEADILAAQKALDDLLFQQRQVQLAKAAADEQKEHDAMIARKQANFAKQLQVIMASHKNINAKVLALLKEFNIDFLNAGVAWGNALAQGIRSAKKAVGDAAAELAQAAKDNTQNNSPKPKKGPLSKKSMFDAGREHGMNWAKGIASAAGAVGKAAATTAGGASGGFGDAKNTGNIFDFGSGTPPPGGFGPDFEGSRPGWADRELWETTAVMAAKLGKFDALIDAVQSGSIKANAGLLSQLFYARTRQTWNDFPARIAKILDDMRGPEGLSSAEAAAKYGLKKGGYVKQDGFAFLHKNEIVTPLPSSGRMSMGSQAININFNGTVMGGTEAQMARVLAPAIENEIRRSQRRGNASIVQAT